ncbi:shikimate kinase [Coraliomargarita sinensis]|uniref:shikimate kinase n=1 Tax=Coraliomargarita sinensis TaxID=2174842 RepID=UPI001E576CB1|nr:shikimate kinase [Coraliomargarita sinensis]
MSEKSDSAKPNLYIVGFMGVGKSAIGRKVARELRYKFIDSDHEIESKEGMKVAEIFSQRGEPAFRSMEREFIESGHPDGSCVVSCGGGLVVQEGMSDLLKEKGVVVCLFASPECIIERTSRNKNRPLLNVDNPEKRVRELLSEREPIYMNAGACITTEGRSMPEVVRHVIRTYKAAARDYA